MTAPIKARVGRKRINAEGGKLTVRLPEGGLDRLNAVLRPGEPQSAFLRETVMKEVDRRESGE